MSLYFANQVPHTSLNANTEMPEYNWIYQRTTVSQQKKQKIIFLAPRKEKRYQYVKYLSSWILCEYCVLVHGSNFIMETEDNSLQRQLYDSSII